MTAAAFLFRQKIGEKVRSDAYILWLEKRRFLIVTRRFLIVKRGFLIVKRRFLIGKMRFYYLYLMVSHVLDAGKQ